MSDITQKAAEELFNLPLDRLTEEEAIAIIKATIDRVVELEILCKKCHERPVIFCNVCLGIEKLHKDMGGK